jgi:hypothetical protein
MFDVVAAAQAALGPFVSTCRAVAVRGGGFVVGQFKVLKTLSPCAQSRLGLGENVKTTQALILMLIVQTGCAAAVAQAQSPNLIGRWNVEITFANGTRHSLRIDAQGAGKGSFLPLDPRSKFWEPGKPSEVKWTQGDGNSVTFSGPVEFLIGNVGRDAGTLDFKGKFETESLITGEVEFSPLVGDGPSKSGTFKGIRAAGG